MVTKILSIPGCGGSGDGLWALNCESSKITGALSRLAM
jgi:hypothetical protein